MAAICLINHSRVIRMSAVPIPGGVGFVAAQRAWPQAGQSRQTLPFPPSRARQRCSADSWPRAAHFPPSSSSSGVPGPLEAAGTRAAGFRLDSASTQVLLAGLPCEASRDSLWRGRRRTPRTKTDSRKQGRPTHISLVCPENEAKWCPPSGQGCLGNPGPGAGCRLPRQHDACLLRQMPRTGIEPGHSQAGFHPDGWLPAWTPDSNAEGTQLKCSPRCLPDSQKMRRCQGGCNNEHVVTLSFT